MSYNISFRVPVKVRSGEPVLIDLAPDDFLNITWNVRGIIMQSTGLPWKNEASNGLCKDVIPHIRAGLRELQSNPQLYVHLEDPDGWGTVQGTIWFFQRVLDAWEHCCNVNPDAVSDVAEFWIT